MCKIFENQAKVDPNKISIVQSTGSPITEGMILSLSKDLQKLLGIKISREKKIKFEHPVCMWQVHITPHTSLNCHA